MQAVTQATNVSFYTSFVTFEDNLAVVLEYDSRSSSGALWHFQRSYTENSRLCTKALLTWLYASPAASPLSRLWFSSNIFLNTRQTLVWQLIPFSLFRPQVLQQDVLCGQSSRLFQAFSLLLFHLWLHSVESICYSQFYRDSRHCRYNIFMIEYLKWIIWSGKAIRSRQNQETAVCETVIEGFFWATRWMQSLDDK